MKYLAMLFLMGMLIFSCDTQKKAKSTLAEHTKSKSEFIGVGAKVPEGGQKYFDGTKAMLDQKWTYWQGPRLKAELPIKWKIEDDPLDDGSVVNTNDPLCCRWSVWCR